MNVVTRNVVVLPDARVRDQAIAWSHAIAEKYKTSFILDDEKYHPHITLYQAAYPEKNIQEVENRIASLAKTGTDFDIRLHGFSAILGFLFFNAEKRDALISLHKAVVTALNPLREGVLIPYDVRRLTDTTVPDYIKSSIRNYGSALAMEAYTPHITIAKLVETLEADRALATLQEIQMSFRVSSISLANTGPDGTVNRIFSTYKFPNIPVIAAQ